jgi:transposase
MPLSRRLKKIGNDFDRLIDSTIVRAHQHAAGARGGQENQGIGRSAGGLSSKLHLCTTDSGDADRFSLTAGQEHDIRSASELTSHLPSGASVAADKGYDDNKYRLGLLLRGIEPIIPSRSNRNYKAPYNREKYRVRSRIECFFNRLKQNRAFATRFDKLASTFLSGTAFLCAILAIKGEV